MACCLGAEESAEVRHSRAIDRQITEDRLTIIRTLNVLLLGTGESGKTTLVKQMKLIYSEGFSETQKEHFLQVARVNAIQSMSELIRGCEILKILFQNEESAAMAQDVTKYFAQNFEGKHGLGLADVPPRMKQCVCSLFDGEPAIRKALLRRSEFQLLDNALFFLPKFAEICESSYRPTNEDVIHARVLTTHSRETHFEVPTGGRTPRTIRITDVGGQRKYRKMWESMFSDVHCLMFVAALSDYDLKLREDRSQNRLQESLNVFEQIVDLQYFRRKNIVLFLNKTDVFEDKLPRSPLSRHFPEYSGSPNAEEASPFIRSMFRSRNKVPVKERQLWVHFTCATDTKTLQALFGLVMSTLTSANLKNTSIA